MRSGHDSGHDSKGSYTQRQMTHMLPSPDVTMVTCNQVTLLQSQIEYNIQCYIFNIPLNFNSVTRKSGRSISGLLSLGLCYVDIYSGPLLTDDTVWQA